MLTKILKIATPIVLILIILFIGYNSYKQVTENTENPLNIIPTNAAIIIKCNDTHKLYKYLEYTPIWQQLKNIQYLNDISEEIKQISAFFNTNKSLLSNSLFVSFHKFGIDQGGILLSTSFDPQAITAEEICKTIGNTHKQYTYDNKVIQEITIHESRIYVAIIEGLVIASTSKILVEDAIRQYASTEKLLTNTTFQQLYNTISDRYDINLFYNINHLAEYTTLLSNNTVTYEKLRQFSSWFATDIDLNKYNITASGFGVLNNTVHNYTDVFVEQKTTTPNITTIIPENTSFLLSLSFSNAAQLYANKNKLLQQNNNYYSWEKEKKHLARTVDFNYDEFVQQLDDEAGVFYSSSQHEKNQYSYLKSKNSILAIGMMQSIINQDEALEYNHHIISKVNAPQIVANLLGNLLEIKSTDYVTIIDDYFVFSSNQTSLQYLIDNYNSDNTLAYNSYYKNFQNQIPNTSNLYLYINPEKYVNTVAKQLNTEWKNKLHYPNDSLDKFTGFSVQFSTQKSLLYNNIMLHYDPSFTEQLSEKWYIQLDTIANLTPQLIDNYFSKELEILLQDKANRIYLYTIDGILKWSKQIDRPIMGTVSQVDYYKNGKLQLLFNTENQLYMIDRLGNFVTNYPIDLPTTTHLSHALFDYDNNKKYRIIIVGDDNNLYNLDKKGKKVKGWKYQKNNSTITAAPIHFTAAGKDYILRPTIDGKTCLLARNGSVRINYSNPIDFTNHPVQIDNKGRVYALTINGRLWIGNTDGTSLELALENLGINSLFVVNNTNTEQKFIYTDGNTVHITNTNFEQKQTIDLKDKILEINVYQEYLIIVTKNELFLYHKGEIVKGTPIKTDGLCTISDIDNNGKINIINAKNGFIYNYELGSVQ